MLDLLSEALDPTWFLSGEIISILSLLRNDFFDNDGVNVLGGRTIWLPHQNYKTILRIVGDIEQEDIWAPKKKPIASVMDRILHDYQTKIRTEREAEWEEERRIELQTLRDEMKQHGFLK